MQWWLKYRFRRTTLWLVAYLAFLGGVGLAHYGYRFEFNLLLISFGLLLCVLKKRNLMALGLILLCGLSTGLWRGGMFMNKLAAYQAHLYQPVDFTAQVMNDGVYGKTAQMSFDVNHVVLDSGEVLVGKTQVGGFGVNAIYQGDVVHVTGKLYPGYSAYQGRVSFGEINLEDRHFSLVAELRRKFTAGMQSALPEPLAPFAMGLLVGQRATLPDDIKQNLLMVGLTHIIAVSGYNLTIMLHASRQLLGKRSKRISTFLTLALIAIFLLIAGASASIVRAAIISVLSIAAAYYGRSFRPLNLLALAAVVTVYANPFYLWNDLSWYLSFLAFYGVMVVGPLLQSRLRPAWQDSLVIGVALESISAEITTLPFVLFVFGQMSLVSLPANILVVTLVPLAMLLGLIAGLAGMLCSGLAGWVAWPAILLLNYMLDTAGLLARMPHIFREGIGFSLAMMLTMYSLVLLMVFLLGRKTSQQKSAIITDKNIDKWQGVRIERTQQMVDY